MIYAIAAGCAVTAVPITVWVNLKLIIPLVVNFSIKKPICAEYLRTVIKNTPIAEALIFSALYSILICRRAARMREPSGFGKKNKLDTPR